MKSSSEVTNPRGRRFSIAQFVRRSVSHFLRFSVSPFPRFPAGVIVAFVCLLAGRTALAEQRFPPPDFEETGHQLPPTTTPAARAVALEYLDVAVLAGCLGLATWFIYRKRSRRHLMWLSVFSLLYFGFWRKGCVCAIGSFQNVALAVLGSGYALPIGVAAFFALPLLVALFAGRAFCSAVCPHGALQDLVLVKPVKVPGWLEQGLSVLPYIYLGVGVLFAATGSAFLVCQYDPFVPVFRMNGRALMVLSGAGLLALGLFVGRPYCRFLCPYGALLKLGATVAKLRIRVTPDYCTQCRLCEAACPFGAMREPEAVKPTPAVLTRDRKRLAWTIALLPLLIAAGVWIGGLFSPAAARVHPAVKLAEQYLREKDAPPPAGTLTPDQLALERARNDPRPVLEQAIKTRKQFDLGSRIFGGWVGLVIGAKLISLCLRRRRTDYEPDRGDCVACARCFEYCPNELVRRGFIPGALGGGQGPAPGTQPAKVVQPAAGVAGKEAVSA